MQAKACWINCVTLKCILLPLPDKHMQQMQQLCDCAAAAAVMSSSFECLWTHEQ